MVLGIRWSLVLLLILGLVKDIVAPYVRFQIPSVVQENAPLVFVICILIALIVQVREAFSLGYRTQESVQKVEVSWIGFIRFFVISAIGVVIAVIFTVFIAVLHGWFSINSISLTFLVTTFFSALGIWFALPLGASVKLPFFGLEA